MLFSNQEIRVPGLPFPLVMKSRYPDDSGQEISPFFLRNIRADQKIENHRGREAWRTLRCRRMKTKPVLKPNLVFYTNSYTKIRTDFPERAPLMKAQ